MPSILAIQAREILDSRGNPTIELDLTLAEGATGRAAVPSGASIGSREVLELRDGEAAYLGKGVLKAVGTAKTEIFQAVQSKELDQQSLDQLLLELDGTAMKSRLGANSILAVSMAFAVAAAKVAKQPLYRYIADLSGQQPSLPMPILNVMNGGAHANWTTDIQEYMLFPTKAVKYSEKLRQSVEVFQHLGKLLLKADLSTNVGNEGGFAPSLSSNEQAFELILEAIEAAGYTAGRDGDFMLGIDAAANEFFKDGSYQLKRDHTTKTVQEMMAWMEELVQKYPIASLEDPLAEEDWASWAVLTAQLGDRIDIVGDDLLVTNPQYIQRAIQEKSCNTALIKLNQIGTLTETLQAISLAKNAGWKTIISHRSGETEDTFIAHLAVGTASVEIKAGAPSRSERTAKYNELLRIEEEIET